LTKRKSRPVPATLARRRAEPVDLEFAVIPGIRLPSVIRLLSRAGLVRRELPVTRTGRSPEVSKTCRTCEAAEVRLLRRPNRQARGDWRSVALVILMLVSIALAALAG